MEAWLIGIPNSVCSVHSLLELGILTYFPMITQLKICPFITKLLGPFDARQGTFSDLNLIAHAAIE